MACMRGEKCVGRSGGKTRTKETTWKTQHGWHNKIDP